MKFKTLLKRKINCVPFGFIIPFSCILFMMIFNGAHPFGDKSLLYSDGYHQYYPFFKEFRRALLSGESLLYSWNVGMGIDYLGLIAYYLASPLNLFSIFVPESQVLTYFSMLTPIKIGLAGLFFSIFLSKLFNKKDFSVPLFGSFYALCAWSLGYQWNIMWLDTFALLPLVALGTHSLLRDKKFVLFTISLFLSVFSNYYIGFFTCIFVLLTFICYQICRWTTFKRFIDDLIRIGLFSILAIGMTAILTLPAFSALQTTQSSVNKYPEDFELNIVEEETYKKVVNESWDNAKLSWKNGEKRDAFSHGWRAFHTAVSALADGMKQIAGHSVGGTSINHKESDALPNVYCGIFTLIFSFLFLTSKYVKIRDKICSVFLLLFIGISFLIRQLDYIWHGFHFTNMIPYRFSFLYSFIMLYMAYRAYLLRRHFKPWQVLIGVGLALIPVFTSNAYADFIKKISDSGYWDGFKAAWRSKETDSILTYLSDLLFPVCNGFIILAVTGTMLLGTIRTRFPKNQNRQIQRHYIHKFRLRQKIASLLLICTLAIELVFNVTNYGNYWSGASITDYPKGKETSASMLNTMRQRECNTLFYRTETTHAQILNDGALNSYNGVSAFTSSANVKVTDFMMNLGYGAKNTYNRYCYEASSPVPNLFLNLKYTLERDGYYYEGPMYRRTTDTNEKYISQKPAYDNPYFDVIDRSSLIALVENNAYLPLGFMCDPKLAEFNFAENEDQFQFEAELLAAASGISQQLWHPIYGSKLSVTGDKGVSITYNNKQGKCRYNAVSDGIVTFAFAADTEGLLCLDISQGKRNAFSVWLNNNHDRYPDERMFSETYSLPQMLSVCNVKPGDIVEVQFKCKAGEAARIEVYGAILNEAEFRNAYEILAESPLQLTSFSNTFVEGVVNCKEDGLLYTSIPQNGENWEVLVDGKPAEITLIGDVMIGVKLSAGTHIITFQYHNKAFVIGTVISLVCLAGFITLWIIFYKPQKKWKNFRNRIKQAKSKFFKKCKNLWQRIQKIQIPFFKKGKYEKK